MREFIEDALEHHDSGYGRAQKHMQTPRPKRFYKTTGVAPVDGGFTVTLDGRPTRTPGRVPVVVPVQAIAEIMAGEWEQQGKEVVAETMPHVRLVNSAIEGGMKALPVLRQEVLKFAAGDLLLYRADTPRELVQEQEKHWDAALVALARHFDIAFLPTVGIRHVEQPPQTLERLQEVLEGVGLFPAAALASITGITGSGLLAIALREQLITPDAAWQAAHVDEDHNARLWGDDPEAAARRARRRIEFDAAIAVLTLAGDY